MKMSRCEAHCNTHALPHLRFESQQLTSLGGLVLLQQLFSLLNLKHRLHRCFDHLTSVQVFPSHRVFLQ
jgi:hypothetical protein